MNVISRRKLRDFWTDNPAAEAAMTQWYKIARKATWHNFQLTKGTFGQTDVATETASGKTATIFDIGGNKWRIVALIDCKHQTMLITHVMDHQDYDRGKWKKDI